MDVVGNILGKRKGKSFRQCKRCGSSGTLLQSSKGGFMCPSCVVYAGYEVDGDNYFFEED